MPLRLCLKSTLISLPAPSHGLMRRGRAGSEKRGNQNDERAERGLHSTVALSRPRGSGRVRSRSRSASTKRLTPASIKSSKNNPQLRQRDPAIRGAEQSVRAADPLPRVHQRGASDPQHGVQPSGRETRRPPRLRAGAAIKPAQAMAVVHRATPPPSAGAVLPRPTMRLL